MIDKHIGIAIAVKVVADVGEEKLGRGCGQRRKVLGPGGTSSIHCGRRLGRKRRGKPASGSCGGVENVGIVSVKKKRGDHHRHCITLIIWHRPCIAARLCFRVRRVRSVNLTEPWCTERNQAGRRCFLPHLGRGCVGRVSYE